jgi:hypothetical protein
MDLSAIDLDRIFLKKIGVSGFLTNRSFSIDFSAQENKKASIFIGPNAMGKTVLCSFVAAVLTVAAALAREKTDCLKVDWDSLSGRPEELVLVFNQFSLRVVAKEENYADEGDGTTFSFFYTPINGSEEKEACLEFEVIHFRNQREARVDYVQTVFSSEDAKRLFSSFGSDDYPFWRFISIDRRLKGELKKSDFVGPENKKVYESLETANSSMGSGGIQTLIGVELNRLFSQWMMSRKRKKKANFNLPFDAKENISQILQDHSLIGETNLPESLTQCLAENTIDVEGVRFVDYLKRLKFFEESVSSFGDSRFAKMVKIRPGRGSDSAQRFRVTITELGKDLVDSEYFGSSSGESNYFTMFYLLCFRTNCRTHVFVDEPELSLALVEQMKLVDNIYAVLRYTGAQAILITHSPFVATGHEDLLAEVKFNG